MTPALVRLTSAASPGFAGVLAIYEEAMPAQERKPRGMIERLPTREDYRVLALEGEGGAVTAFSMILAPPGAHFALLEYMAVRAGLRGRGLGSMLYREGLAALRAEGPRSLLIEVDSERAATDDRDLRLARKRFYRRLGCRQAEGLNYLLPLWPNWTPPVMDLLIDPDPPTERLAKATLAAFLDGAFQGAYGRAPHDPRIAEMLADVSDPAEPSI